MLLVVIALLFILTTAVSPKENENRDEGEQQIVSSPINSDNKDNKEFYSYRNPLGCTPCDLSEMNRGRVGCCMLGGNNEDASPSYESRVAAAKLSTLIVYAKVLSVKAGIATMSLPPLTRFMATVDGVNIVRGAPSSAIAGTIMYMMVGFKPLIAENQYGLFYGSSDEESGRDAYSGVIAFDSLDDLQKFVKAELGGMVCWKSKTESPFAKPVAKKVNYLVSMDQALAVCEKTKRAAFEIPPGLAFSVEQVVTEEMKRENNYVNPYGDGEFKITVTNNTDHDIVLPALLRDDATGEILFERCMILTEKKEGLDQEGEPAIYIFDQEPVASATAVTIAAHSAVSGIVNTLKLKINWMCGGSRYYFNFFLGNLCATNFFYYMTNHHGKIITERGY